MIWKRKKPDDDIRNKSWQIVKKLGYPINPSLPPLESDLHLRSLQDIQDRALLLNVVCALSYGFQQSKAQQWLKTENLEHALSSSERAFIFDGRGEKTQFQRQVEAIWAFLWIMSMVSDLKFNERCSDNLVKMLPDLKKMESSPEFRNKTAIRPQLEIITMFDLVYCLHWGQQQFNLNTGTWKYPPNVIEERRRALEWTLSDVAWDDISLDT